MGGAVLSFIVGLGSGGAIGSIVSSCWSALVMKVRTAGESGLFLSWVGFSVWDFCVLECVSCFFLCVFSCAPKAVAQICFLSSALVCREVAMVCFVPGVNGPE